MKVEKRIIDILRELRVPAGTKGFRYILMAINEVLSNEELLSNMTKPNGLYDRVAKEHDSTKSRVERAIRHGIECSFKTASSETLCKYFGHSDGKETNSNFIATIAYEVKYGGKVNE